MLVKSAVRAEIPEFEIVQTLAVFLSNLENNEVGDDVVRRVAKFFKVDPDSR